MTSPSPARRGFSLIEVWVSMTLGCIVLLAAAAMLGNAGVGYGRVGGGVAAEREARGLFTQLAADLSTARFHKQGVMKKSSANWPTDRLGCLFLQPAGAQSSAGCIGDLCAVNYYVRDLTIGGKTMRCLMRGCRESKETFSALENDSVNSLFTERHLSDEPVAFGVVSFVARPKSRDLSGKWRDWGITDITGPAALDVRLVLARNDLAAKLKCPQDWDGDGTGGCLLGPPSAALRNANLEVYATLIRFGNHDHPSVTAP